MAKSLTRICINPKCRMVFTPVFAVKRDTCGACGKRLITNEELLKRGDYINQRLSALEEAQHD